MSDSTQGPGEALKTAREALNVSDREVANALNLPLNVVQAMESDDFEALPPPVFTRGYLRSYARLLELDEDELVSRLPHSEDDALVLTAEIPAVTTSRLPVDKQVLMLAGGIAAAVLLVILVIVATSSEPEQAQPVIDAAERTQAQTDPDTALRADADTRQSGSRGSADASPDSVQTGDQGVPPEVPEDAPNTLQTSVAERGVTGAESAPLGTQADTIAAANEPAATPAASSATRASPPDAARVLSDPTPAGMRRITPFGEDVLTISFTEDCWVDIKDRAGARLYGDLIRGGRTIALIGDAPFQILLGYAPGARLSFNGEDIDLDRITRNNVARLTVGD